MFIRNITLFALLQPFVAGENVRGTRNLAECPGEDSNPTIDDPVTERVSTCTRAFSVTIVLHYQFTHLVLVCTANFVLFSVFLLGIPRSRNKHSSRWGHMIEIPNFFAYCTTESHLSFIYIYVIHVAPLQRWRAESLGRDR